jgi:hypothetical protein
MREGDRTRNVSKMDGIIEVTLNKALQGDFKAVAAFIQFARCAGLTDERPEPSSTESISAEDEAILTGYLKRHGLEPHEERARRPKPKKSPTRQQRRKSPEDKT